MVFSSFGDIAEVRVATMVSGFAIESQFVDLICCRGAAPFRGNEVKGDALMPRPQPSRRLLRVTSRRITFESLEARCVLTAELVSSGIASLGLDPHGFDDQTILVRFEEEVLTPVTDNMSVPAVDLSTILPGSRTEPLISGLPALQRIVLPETVDVDQALTLFRSRSDVLYAEPNYRLQASVLPDDTRFGEMWALENLGQTGGVEDADIDAAGAWDIHTGSGSMLVAVIDTGINYNHPDLSSNIWTNTLEIPGDNIDNDGNGYIDDLHGYDFFNEDGDPMDDNGHGTHVAGTIGAVGDNGLGVAGINWDIQIMGLKFLGADGSGSTDDAIEAINYAVTNGARLSNNSWGGDPYSQALYDAIAAAGVAGHAFIAAAGNGNFIGVGQNNDVNLFYPSGYELDNILAVAAIDHQDHLASFSNFGATTVDSGGTGRRHSEHHEQWRLRLVEWHFDGGPSRRRCGCSGLGRSSDVDLFRSHRKALEFC